MVTPNTMTVDEYIAKNSRDVFIDATALRRVAQQVICFAQWHYKNGSFGYIGNFFSRNLPEIYPCECESNGLDWLFVLHTMNFTLWRPNSIKQWTVNGLTGFLALCAAIKRAIDEKKPIWNPSYYSSLTLKEAKIIFRGDDDVKIPLLRQRVNILHQVGQVLLNSYEGSFAECVKRCNNKSAVLLKVIYEQFESYRDRFCFNNKIVSLYSKASILVLEVNILLRKKPNIFAIYPTVLIDYRVPQVLYYCGILHYSDRLLSRLKKIDKPLEFGSREEAEIRACSLNSATILCETVLTMMERCTDLMPFLKRLRFNVSILVSNFLWNYRVVHDKRLLVTVPFHHTRSIYY